MWNDETEFDAELSKALEDPEFGARYDAATTTQRMGLRYMPRRHWDATLTFDPVGARVEDPARHQTEEPERRITFEEALELELAHEPFAAEYAGAAEYSRRMLRGIPPSFWLDTLRSGKEPRHQDHYPLPGKSERSLSEISVQGSVERAVFRCGEVLASGERCNAMVARGFFLDQWSQPTGLLVYKGAVRGKTVLCHVVVEITNEPAPDGGRKIAVTAQVPKPDGGFERTQVLHNGAVLATCGERHRNLVVGLAVLAARLSGGKTDAFLTTH